MKKLGFIVSEQLIGNTELITDKESSFKDIPKGGVLMYGDKVTVFKTKRAAKAAIKRTNEFTAKHNFNWGNIYNIVQVVSL
jgi:hypothetical protein